MSSGPRDESCRRLDEAVLRALFTEATFGLHVLDTDLRIVRMNAAAQHNPNFPGESALGRHLWEAAPGFAAPERARRLLRDVLETGKARVDVVLTGRSPLPPHRRLALSVSVFRLEDADGQVLGLAVSVVDVTEQHRAWRRLRLLERVDARLNATMDVFGAARELAAAAVPELADAVAVDVLDSLLRGEAPPPGPILEDLPLRRAAYQGGPPAEDIALYQVGERSGYRFGSPFTHVLADLEPRLVPDLRAASETMPLEPPRREALKRLGAHSLLVTPLTARGMVMGLAALYRVDTPTPFDDADLSLAQDLAARTAICLDNARLYNRERAAARLLQLTVRPPRSHPRLAVDTVDAYQPVGPGGDWFDVIPLSGERVALVAGDTADQGLPAVAGMAELRAAVGALAVMDLPPEEVLARLHALVVRLAEDRPDLRRHFPETRVSEPQHTTCLYVTYDPVSRRCRMASASHPPPAIAHVDGAVSYAPVQPGPPLGQGLPHYTSVELDLPAGTVLVLYNAALLRGLDEDNAEPRPDRLLAALAERQPALRDWCDSVFATLTPRRPRGDVVLLLARTHVLGPDRAATWTWPPDPASVGQARAAVRERLDQWGLAELSDTAALIVSELATNAITYARGRYSLRLVRGETGLACEVTDDSYVAPQLRHAEADDEGGRGLVITSSLTNRWGVRPTAAGKTIWAELPFPDMVRSEDHCV